MEEYLVVADRRRRRARCLRSPSPSQIYSGRQVQASLTPLTWRTPPRGLWTRGNTRRGRESSKSGSSRSKRGVGPDPGSVSLGSGSAFVITEDRYVVTNFHVVERAYNMTLGTEERNAYAVKFLSNVTEYIMVNSPPLSSTPLSELFSPLPKFSSRSLLLLASEILNNRTRSALLKGATLPGGMP